LINALYDGSEHVSTETEVTYEDGRKGSIKATLELRDAKVFAPVKMAARFHLRPAHHPVVPPAGIFFTKWRHADHE